MLSNIARLGVISSLIAATAHAEVSLNVATVVPITPDRIAVDVVLDSDGEGIGGLQNDIVFDHTVVRLESAADCRINPAYGTTPVGTGDGVVTCVDDPT